MVTCVCLYGSQLRFVLSAAAVTVIVVTVINITRNPRWCSVVGCAAAAAALLGNDRKREVMLVVGGGGVPVAVKTPNFRNS